MHSLPMDIASELDVAMTNFRPGGINQAELAKLSKVPQSTISRTLKGISVPETATIIKLATALRCSLGGHSGITEDRTGADDALTPVGAHHFRAAREVPVVGNTQAGPPDRIWEEMNYPAGYGDEYLELATPDPHAYALRVVGDSMAPRVMAGEWLLVEPSQPPHPGDDVIVKTTAGDVMVKQLVYQSDSEIILASVNEAFKRITIATVDLVFIHFVAGRFSSRSVKQRVGGQIGNRRIMPSPVPEEKRADARFKPWESDNTDPFNRGKAPGKRRSK